MKKCAILTMDSGEDFGIYDHLLEEPLKAAGWLCDTVSWRSQTDWNQYQLVMIRSPWDYQQTPQAFLDVLQSIEDSNAILANSLDVVKWNIDKRYLKDLQDKGSAIVPTEWHEQLTAETINKIASENADKEFVIKPCISANADDTYRLNSSKLLAQKDELLKVFTERPLMLQPFVDSVVLEGEFSLFYFDGQYSHAILKTPKSGDFRVQEEHGGRLKNITPCDSLKSAADKTLAAIDFELLYARLDFVRQGNEFLLMEAELIEPSLYFQLDPQSPKRYVEAVERQMARFAINA